MLLGVISDTHGHVKHCRTAIELFESAGVDLVVHCGDIGQPEIISLFHQWPTHFVFGNVDRDEIALQSAIRQAGQTSHGRFGTLDCEGQRIAFLHGDDSVQWKKTVDDGQWDLVCYGHTHRAELKQVGSTMLLNPGAVYRANPHSVAVVELSRLSVQFMRF